MQKRLHAALTNPDVSRLVREDLYFTFKKLGLGDQSENIISNSLCLLENTDLHEAESFLHKQFKQLKTSSGKTIFEAVDAGLKDRATRVFGQVSKFLPLAGKIVDWGCGDGLVTDLVYKHISLKTEGFDVCRYSYPGISASLKHFSGKMVHVRNGFYDAGLMTNVAHHEPDNQVILDELSRIIKPGGRLVVIETVPISDDPKEFERTFVNDYYYNRLFHEADIPVPGTYETEAGWVTRFHNVGFRLVDLAPREQNPTPLGYDQPLIRDWHTRMVFKRN